MALLLDALRPYPGRVATLGALVLGSTAIQVGVPLGIREVVDRATLGDVAGAWTVALGVVGAGLLAQAGGLAEAWVSTDLGQLTTNDVRARLVRAVLGFDGEFHAANPPGALVERVDGDTAQLTALFSRVVVESIQAVLVLLGTLAMAWTIAPGVAVGLAVTIAVTGVALQAVVAAGHAHRIARSAAGAALFGAVEERLAGIEDVRASGTVALAAWQVEAAARAWLQRSFSAMAWNAGSGATVGLASGALTAVAFAGAGLAATRGEASVGDVVALLAYVEVVRRPVEQLARQARELGNAVAGAARVSELLSLDPRIPPFRPQRRRGRGLTPFSRGNGEGDSVTLANAEEHWEDAPRASNQVTKASSRRHAVLPGGALAIDLEGAGVTYPGAERAALADVSVAIPAGAFVGVVGRTGSGKTSFGRLVVRAIATSRGQVRLGGVDLGSVPEAELRARVAIVAQEPSLFHATVRENVTLFDDAVPDATVQAALVRVGLGDWLAAQPDGLRTRLAPSGGQGPRPPAWDATRERQAASTQTLTAPGGLSAGEAQLLGLARVFVRDAGLVVLDEPAARVDPVTERRLVAALRELAQGRTVIVVAHRGSTLVDASHLLEVDDGRVVRFGKLQADDQAGTVAWTAGSDLPGTTAAAPTLYPSLGVARQVGTDARSRTLTDAGEASEHGATPPERQVSAREVAGAIWATVQGFAGWWIASITLAGMVGYALTLGAGVIQRGFVDAVASGEANTWWWAAGAVGFGAVRALHFLAAVTVEPWTQSRGAATIAVNAVEGALRARSWPLLPVSPGEAVGRLRDDAAVIGRFTTYLGDPVGQVILGGSAWWFLAARDPWIAAGAFLPIVVLGVVAQVASPLVSRTRRAAADGVSAVTDLLADAFAHAAAVRLEGATERLVAAVAARGEVRRAAAVREALVAQGVGAAWRHVGTVASGALLLASVSGLADGRVSAGDVALGVALTQSLTFLGEVYGELMLLARGSVVAFGRIGVLVPGQPLASLGARRALSLSGLGPSAPPRPAISGSDALRELSVHGLSFRHGGAGGGIHAATFSATAGTLVAVTGPAGGGKSTLVRAMLGLVPASGEVRWNGRIVEDRGGWLVPPRLSWTPQSPRLFSGSVRENVLGVPDGIGQAGAVGSADAAEAARLNRAIWLAGLDVDLATGSLSLDARVGPRGLRLSGGQQQRVAAARMFATGAPVIVVDDVSSALDEATESVVWDRVLGDAGAGMTVVAVTNRPSVIARASLVLVVESGRCRVAGAHD